MIIYAKMFIDTCSDTFIVQKTEVTHIVSYICICNYISV